MFELFLIKQKGIVVSVACDQISVRITKHKPANEEHEDEGRKVHNLVVRSPKLIHHL